MALKLTVESFLQVVRQSGLIDKDQLQKLLQSYADRGVDVKKSQALADALVGNDVITRWQAEKLLAGKHKGFFLGKYRLLDLLGKGGMSSVYLAEHVLMKRRCAIKVLPSKRVNDTSYLARFHREAQAVASVDHPNIVRAYDVDCAQDRDTQIHFLVMEYVNGQSMQELIVRNGPAEYADAIEYIRQSAEGLEHAHRAGLVHRDIKPGNLLIDTHGTIKILDMGLARFFDDRDENPLTVAHDEKVLGTADYLAPEQALDSHSVDTRADIYSLGCTLYFFLTGHPPFTEGTLTQRLMWHQTKPFPPLTESRLDCPASLVALLNKMVEKKPEDRYQSAAKVAEACRQWLAENAGADWKQRHVPHVRTGRSGTQLASPSTDLPSDPVMPKAASHVLGSSVEPRDDDGSSATKISRPGAVSAPSTAVIGPVVATPAVPPTVAKATPASPPVAAPVVAKPVAPVAPPVAPVAPPIAQPVAVPPPPIARPVVPVAAPVVSLAQPVKVAAPVATPIAPVAAPVDATVAPTEDVPNFFFGSEPAVEETIIAPEETASESVPEGDLFSLFGGGHDEPPATQPETAPLASSAEPTSTTLSPPEETISFEPSSEPQPDDTEFSFVGSDSPKTESVPKKPPEIRALSFKKPMPLYATIAAAVLVVIGGVVWWSTHGTSVAKTNQKDKGTKSLANKTTGGSKKSDAHEVMLQVGAGGDFKSIGRALHSVIEGRAEHEKAASGKPLRFLINVNPGQPFEESIVLDERFPGELHLKSDTPGKSFKVKSPSKEEPAITINNLTGVTIENASFDLADFPPRDKAIVLSGSTARCRIKNCVVSGAGMSGIELRGATGGEGTDGIVLEAITFQNAAPTAFGVSVAKPTNGALTQQVTVQRCRFIGSMSAGVFVEGPVDSLTIRNCGVSGAINGIRFVGGVVAKNVLIDHCSFRNLPEAGLLFDGMPGAGAGELVWRNCLFAGVKKTELLIAKDYDANKFGTLLSADKPVENNWSDRDATIPVNGERDLLGKGGSRVPSIQFAATSANSELFLVAKAGEPYKTAGIKAK